MLKDASSRTIYGFNYYLEEEKKAEVRDCIEYFKEYEKNPNRRRRTWEAYEGWPLLEKWQVEEVEKNLNNIEVVEKDGIYLVKLVRKNNEEDEAV